MQNPKSAVDSLLQTDTQVQTKKVNLAIYPVTIARYALLELIESPFVTNKKFTTMNTVVSVYIMTQPIENIKGYNSTNISKLEEKAIEWCDSYTPDAFTPIVDKIVEQFKLLFKVSPDSNEDGDLKKSQVSNTETAG